MCALTNPDNTALTASYSYDAYGNKLQLTTNSSTASGANDYMYVSSSNAVNLSTSNAANNNPMRYCGEMYDQYSSTIYLRARSYAPELNHFLQQDSYLGENGEIATRNLYTYCEGDPVNNCDPSGHKMVLCGNIKRIKKYLKLLTGAKKNIKTKKSAMCTAPDF